jgi:hypothetical protein
MKPFSAAATAQIRREALYGDHIQRPKRLKTKCAGPTLWLTSA